MRFSPKSKAGKLGGLVCIAAALFAGFFASEQHRHDLADFVFARGKAKAAITSVTLNNGNGTVLTGNDVTSQTVSLSPDIGAYRWAINGADLSALDLPFNTGTSQTDFSGNGRTGTLQSGAAYTGSGKVGGAVSFDGVDDYISFASVPTNFPKVASLWINPTDNTDRVLFDDNGTFSVSRLYLNGSGQAVYTYYDNTFGCISATSTSTVSAGQWTHIAAKVTSTSVSVYVNGTLENTNNSLVNPANNNPADFKIGKGAIGQNCLGTVPSSFQGSIDEFQVYFRNLTDAQIGQIYADGNAGLGGPTVIKSAETAVGQHWDLTVTPITSAGSVGSAIRSTNHVLITSAASAITGSLNSANEITDLTSTLTIPSGSIAAYAWWLNNARFMVLNVPFNSGATVSDLSGYAITGTPLGNATHTTSGCKVGGCYSFDGSGDSVNLGTPVVLQITTMTAEAWIKRNAINVQHIILASANGGWAFYVKTNNTLGFGKVGTSEITSSGTISDTNWHHVAFTYNGTTASFYIDGVLSSSSAYANPSFATTQKAIGIRPDNSTDSFNGLIDEVRIYPRVLTAEQINRSYVNGLGSSQSASNGVGGPDLISKQEHAIGDVWDLDVSEILSSGALNGTSFIGRTTIAAVPATTISVNTPVGVQAGSITITYSCSAADNTTRDLLVEYSTNGGGSFSSASIGSSSSGTISSSTITGAGCAGASQTFVWNSIANNVASGTTNSNVRIRLTAQVTGSPTGSTGNFAVANSVINNFNSSTTIAAGNTTYDNTNVSCTGGTLTINGTHTFTSLTIASGCTLTHSGPSTTPVTKMNLTITGAFAVDTGASVNVSGVGFIGGSQPGAPSNLGWTTDGAGGGQAVFPAAASQGAAHGGRGVNWNGSATTNAYDSVTNPTEPGAGAGEWNGAGANGGGAVIISAASITINGTMTANAVNGPGWQGGAGGTLNLVASGSISGSGTLTANGSSGANNTPGGGGRIALIGSTVTLPVANISVTPGLSSAAPGTIYIKQTSDGAHPNGLLYVKGTTTIYGTPVAGSYNFSSITVNGGGKMNLQGASTVADTILLDNGGMQIETTGSAVVSAATFTMSNSAILTQSGPSTTSQNKINLTVANAFTVDATSQVNLDGKGFIGGSQSGAPSNVGWTSNGSGGGQAAFPAVATQGAAHGGRGVNWNGSAATEVYDSVINPTEPGAGAGEWNGAGANGGGAIIVSAASIVVNGTISANSVNGAGWQGGAGGTVNLQASGSISGTGTITTNGSNGTNNVPGGGGRVALIGSTVTLPVANVAVNPGLSSAGPGTIYVKETSDLARPNGRLYVKGTASSYATPVAGSLNFDDITVSGGGKLTLVGASTVSDAISLDNGGLELNTTGTSIVAANSFSMQNSSLLTHYPTDTSIVQRLKLNVTTSFTQDATSTITVTGRGFLGGSYPGSLTNLGYTSNGSGGMVAVFPAGATVGAAHGGRGVNWSGASNTDAYDSLVNPTEPGAGAGEWNGVGGNGGGSIIITAASITLNGTTVANAQNNNGWQGGAGGTVNFQASGTISGSGTISTNGSNGTNNVGGGGGRIALIGNTVTVPVANMSSGPGTTSAAPGTIFIKETSDGAHPNGKLYVRNATSIYGTPVAGTLNLNSITISNGAKFNLQGASTISDTILLDNGGIQFETTGSTTVTAGVFTAQNSSIVTHSGPSMSAQNKINLSVTGAFTVDATSQVNLDGKGFLGGSQSGNPSNLGWSSNGAGGGVAIFPAAAGQGAAHGGRGLNWNGASGTDAYDSISNPTEPGAGAGEWNGGGGNGGGSIIVTAGSAVLNGTLSANAVNGSGWQGGAGGTINIQTAGSVSGNGTITVNGSTGTNGQGGAGGRIAIAYGTNSFVGITRAYGVSGGAAGTICLRQFSSSVCDLTIDNNNSNVAAVTPAFYTNSPTTRTFGNVIVDHFGRLSFDSPGTSVTVGGYVQLLNSGTIINNIGAGYSLAAISISTTTLPAAPISQAYSQTLQGAGGYGPYTWVCRNAGATVACSTVLPPGLSMSSAGVISGTPTVAGTYNFTVRATEASPGSGFAERSLSITVSNSPLAPTNLFSNSTNAQACCTVGSTIDSTPVFSAVFNDNDVADTSSKYRIQVASDSGFTTLLWDSGAAGTSMSGCLAGARCQDISYGGSALTMGGVTYYWKIKFWDSADLEGAFSSAFTFVTDIAPSTPTNLFSNESTAQTGLTNPIGMTTAHPVFSAIYHDSDLGDVANKYRIQVDDNSNFSSPIWDSGAAGTSMTSCNEGARCTDITFGGSDLALDGATYYWRIKFWDVSGQQSPWSEDPTATNRFTMGIGAPATISTTTLPNGQVGNAYNQSLSATAGGFTPYAWTCRSGLAGSSVACTTVLPPGLNMSGSGVISGTPTTNGLYAFVVRVTEASPGTSFDEASLSIAIGNAPTAPTTLFTHSTNAQLGSANPTGIDATPVFSAIFHDPDASDTASKYEVQVATDNAYNNIIWDSGAGGTSMTSCGNNTRCASINFGGSALALDGSTYYWRIRFWDQNGIVGAFSTESATFVVDRTPTAPSTLFSAESNAQIGTLNPTGIRSIRPVFSAVFNDPDTGDSANKYRIQVDNNNTFSSPAWDSGASGTSMTSCAQGARCADIAYGAVLPLAIDGTVYYWRIKFFDAAGVESPWSEDPIATHKFTMGEQSSNIQQQQQVQSTVPNTPSVGAVQVLGSSSLRYTWVDNSSNEAGFRLLDDQNNVIAEVAAGVTTADEINLSANTAVSGRRVVAFNNVGVSAPSDAFPTTVTAALNVRPVVVKRGVNSVTFTISPSLTTQNLQEGNTAVLYEVIIRPSDPTQPVRTLTSDWQKSAEYTFTGIGAEDQVEVRVVTRNQTGYANDPTEYVPVDQLEHVFTVNLNVVKKGTGERPQIWSPTDLVAVSVRIKNSGSAAATNVFTNMMIPPYIKYQFGSLTIDGRTVTDIADDDVALTSDRDISAIWPHIASGEEHTMAFNLAFDQAALRVLKTAAQASANPLISLQVTVGFSESDQTFASPVVTLEPNIALIADEPTQQEQQVLQEVPVPAPTVEDTQQVSNLLDQLIQQEAQTGTPSGSEQPVGPQTKTSSSSDGASFNVDVVRTDGQALSVTGYASPNQGQIEFTGTTSAPNSIVTLIFNNSVTVIVVSDENGNWHTFVSAEQLGIKSGQSADVSIEAIAAKGDLRSDKVSVGHVNVSLENTGDITTNFESTVSAIPGFTVVNEIRKEVAKAIVRQEPAIQRTLATTAPVIVVSSVPLWGYLPYLPTMIYHAITYLVGFIGRKRKNQKRFYGVVYDSISKQPLALAIIRIYNKETNKLVGTQVSDKLGRYEALLEPATYRLEVTKPTYTFPSHIVTQDVDGSFQHIYHNEQGMTVQAEDITVPDVPIDPINAQRQWQVSHGFKKIWLALQNVGNYLAAPVLIVGSLASVAVVATIPENPLNWLLAGSYVVMLAAQLKLRPHIDKAWGVVYDLATNAALPLTTIQLIDPQYGKVVTSRLTDYQGRYSFLPEPGHYVLRANKPGFEQVREVLEAPDKNHHPIAQEVDVKKEDQRITGDVPMRQA